VELGGNGGSLTLRIANHSYRPVSDVHLVDVIQKRRGRGDPGNRIRTSAEAVHH
jgi:hypothetical protein